MGIMISVTNLKQGGWCECTAPSVSVTEGQEPVILAAVAVMYLLSLAHPSRIALVFSLFPLGNNWNTDD